MRQADLAERVGTHVNTLARWEDGARPRARWIPLLAEALNVDAAQLEAEIAAWRPPAQPSARRRVDVFPA
jgi:transcriptional regulator with XRE-family HTH domain